MRYSRAAGEARLYLAIYVRTHTTTCPGCAIISCTCVHVYRVCVCVLIWLRCVLLSLLPPFCGNRWKRRVFGLFFCIPSANASRPDSDQILEHARTQIPLGLWVGMNASAVCCVQSMDFGVCQSSTFLTAVIARQTTARFDRAVWARNERNALICVRGMCGLVARVAGTPGPIVCVCSMCV